MDCICPICRELPVPPVTLTPCGHRVCGECLQELRAGAGTRNSIRTAEFRCPICRVMVLTYVVSVSEREALLQNATLTEEQRNADRVFMDDYAQTAADAAPPTYHEMRAAYGDEAFLDDSDSELAEPLLLGQLLVMPQPLPSSGPRRSQRQVPSQQAAVIERRVPVDLRMWDQVAHHTDGLVGYEYILYREVPLSFSLMHALNTLFNPRGIEVSRDWRGILLWLPVENADKFTI